jgi:hypothetical protein
MADETKKVLVDVIVNVGDAVKDIAELRQRTTELRKEQKELDTSTAEGAQRFEELALQIKQNNTELRNRQNEVTKSMQLSKAEVGSLDALKAQIALATKAYDSMDEAKRKSAEGQAYKKFIKESSDALKDEKKAIGDTRLEVGNYQEAVEKALERVGLMPAVLEQSNKSLGEMRTELKALQSISFGGLAEEDANKVKASIASVRDEIKDYQKDIANLRGNPFGALIESANVAVASVAVLGNGLRGLGVESEWLDKLKTSTTQLIATMQALGIISEYLNKQRYRSLLLQVQGLATTIREVGARKMAAATAAKEAAAETASAGAKGLSAIATKALTTATWLWNAALYANPVAAVIVGVLALTATLIALALVFKRSSDEAKRAAQSQKEYEVQVKTTETELSKIDLRQIDRMEKMKNANDAEINQLRKNGATKQEIAQRQFELDNRIRLNEINNISERLNQQNKLSAANKKVIDDKKNLLATYDVESKKYKKLKEEIDILEGSYRSLTKEINTANNAITALQNQGLAAELDNIQAIKTARKEAADKAFAIQEKMLENTKRIQESSLKISELAYASDFTSQQEYARKTFDLNQKLAKDRFELQLRYGKLTRDQYAQELKLLENQQIEFTNSQIQNFNKYQNDLLRQIQTLVGKTISDQLSEIDDKYSSAIEKLKNEIRIPVKLGQTGEEFNKQLEEYARLLFDLGQTEAQLLKEQEKEKEAIRKAGIAKSIKEIETEVAESYSNDLALYADNERKKLQTTIDMLNAQIKKKREAGLTTLADEATLRTTEAQLITQNANIGLLQADLSAQKKYDIEKERIDRLRELYKDNQDKLKELDAQELENFRTLQEARVEIFEDATGRMMKAFEAFNDLTNSIGDRQIQKVESDNKKQKDSLDQRLKAGKISQEGYNREVEKLDKDLDKKRSQIARQAAIREKTLQAVQIGINTAAAVMKTTATVGMPAAIPLNILTSALGAVQLAAVLAAPIPQAKKGMLLSGPSHAGGGIAIEAEGGEVIINKKSANMFLPLLSAINEMGGGVPFVSPNSDGGFAMRMNSPANQNTIDDMAEAFSDAISELVIYTTIEDIRREDKKYSNIESVGNI